MECFVRKDQGFEFNAGEYGEPMKVTEERSDMGEFGFFKDEAGCSILNKLEGLNGRGWETGKQNITVIETGTDKCLDEDLGGFSGEEMADFSNVEEGESTGTDGRSDEGGK